jgi:5'-3' exonuclease
MIGTQGKKSDRIGIMKKLCLLDGSGMFYRYLYCPGRQLSVPCANCNTDCIGDNCFYCNGTGREPTKAVWHCTSFILKLMKEYQNEGLVVFFDGPRKLLKRKKLYPEYKKGRGNHPEGYKPQLRRIKQIISALGICLINCREFEADDYIATVALRYVTTKREVVIVTRDKDMLQLCINDNIFCYDPITNKYAAKLTAGKRYGIATTQLLDYFILIGDSADNVPGVSGVGEKTAAKLLNRYRDIADVIVAATMGHLPKKLAASICKASANGWLKTSRELLTLDMQVPVEISRKDMLTPEIDMKLIRPILRRLQFQESKL